MYREFQQPCAGQVTEHPWYRKGQHSEQDTPYLVAFHLLQVNSKSGKEHDEQQSHAAEELDFGGDMKHVKESRSDEHACNDESCYLRKP